MKAVVTLCSAIALGACAPYPPPHPVAVSQVAIPDPVGLIVAEGAGRPVAPPLPGLLTMAGAGLAAGGSAADRVLIGPYPY